MKFIPNQNRLVTCGNDGCFKSWSLIENRPQVSPTNEPTGASSQGPSSSTSWIYSTCNGYRDLTPNDIDIVQLTNDSSNSNVSNLLDRQLDGSIVAVAFNHIVVLWHHSEYAGLEYIDELINCDIYDAIKQVRFVYDTRNRLNLVAVHTNYINIWRKSNDVDSGYECVWSHNLAGREVTIHDHPLSYTGAPSELLLTCTETSSKNAATNSRNLSIKSKSPNNS